MSGMTVDFKVNNESVEDRLRRMDTGFSAAAWSVFLYGVVGPYLRERAEARFAAEGDDVSGKWLPHHPTTRHFRQSQGYPEGPINHRTGEMERWITQGQGAAIPVGPAALLTFPDPALPMDADLVEKVRTAQGGKAQPKTPARPVLGINGQDAIHIVAAMSFYANSVTSGVGRP